MTPASAHPRCALFSTSSKFVQFPFPSLERHACIAVTSISRMGIFMTFIMNRGEGQNFYVHGEGQKKVARSFIDSCDMSGTRQEAIHMTYAPMRKLRGNCI